MDLKLPEYLYKYTKVDQNFINMLVEKKLRFSSPLTFNDPFDCKLYDKYELDAKEWKKYFLSLDPEGYRKKFEAADKNLAIYTAKFQYMDAIQKAINQIGVCCFSADENNLLLWGHYADSHKGACIKFRTSELSKVFPIIRWIQYSQNFPEVEVLKDFHGALDVAPLHKSLDWSYEKEIRIINGEHGFFDFPSEAIEQITFGVKCERETLPLETLREFKRIGYKKLRYIFSTQSRQSYKVVQGGEWGF